MLVSIATKGSFQSSQLAKRNRILLSLELRLKLDGRLIQIGVVHVQDSFLECKAVLAQKKIENGALDRREPVEGEESERLGVRPIDLLPFGTGFDGSEQGVVGKV